MGRPLTELDTGYQTQHATSIYVESMNVIFVFEREPSFAVPINELGGIDHYI